MGEFLIVLVAVCWSGTAGCYGRAARQKLDMLPFVAIVASTGAVLSGAAVLRWQSGTSCPALIPLLILMIFSGVLGQLSMLMNGQAMRTAPARCAVSWTLFQMSMALPFLWAWGFWGQPVAWYQWTALAPLLAALAALAPSDKNTPADGAGDYARWVRYLALGCVAAGLSQTLGQEPSLRCWADPMNLRAPLSLAAAGAFLWLLMLWQRQRPTPAHWKLGLPTGILVATSNVILYLAQDRLTPDNRTYLTYPVAVGGSVLFFALYQLVMRKEPFNGRKIFGLTCGVAAVGLLTLRLP